jgi:rhodanese-related sulfurtransferase
MKYLLGKLDVILNIAIVIAALTLCVFLVQRYFRAESSDAAALNPQAEQLANADNNVKSAAAPAPAPGKDSEETKTDKNAALKSAGETKDQPNFIDDKAKRVSEDEYRRAVAGGQKLVVIDVRDRPDFARGHFDGAINIPIDEVEVRAINELSTSDLILAYCGCTDDSASLAAQKVMNKQGFQRVLVLWDSKSSEPCPTCQK